MISRAVWQSTSLQLSSSLWYSSLIWSSRQAAAATASKPVTEFCRRSSSTRNFCHAFSSSAHFRRKRLNDTTTATTATSRHFVCTINLNDLFTVEKVDQRQRHHTYRWFASSSLSVEDRDRLQEEEEDAQQQQQQQQQRPALPPLLQRFEDLEHLHPKTLKALRRNGIHKLTEIQQKTYQSILEGKNVVARSTTGSGKTLAFMVPALERYIQQFVKNQEDEGIVEHTNEAGIPILILAPTRELAAQIGSEAQKLLSAHTTTTTTGGRRSNLSRMTVQVMHGGGGFAGGGGGSKQSDIENLEKNLPTILVSTPGRLKDHIATTNIRVQQLIKQQINKSCRRRRSVGNSVNEDDDIRDHDEDPSIKADDDDYNDDHVTMMTTVHKPFSNILQQSVKTLVLDETDRLLELGFRKDIMDIVSFLPPPLDRQTLFFSATLPPHVLDVIDSLTTTTTTTTTTTADDHKNKYVTNANYVLIDCIQEDDPSTHTNERTTQQSYVVVPDDRFWTSSMEVIWDLMSSKTANKNMSNENHKKKNKVMVFFPMTSLVQLYADIFNFRFGKRVWELHGKMYQRERSVVSRRFRNAPDGVLFTSDVSARGIDYPNVTHVVQVGAPQSRETYIHRLGRTGRAGKHGEGLLILPELEKSFIEDLIESPTAPFSQSEECSNYLASMNIQHDDELQRQLLRSSRRKGSYYQQLQEELGQLRHDMHRQTDGTISSSLYLAYQAMISYYFQSSDRNRSDDDVVAFINQLVDDLGSNELPAVDELRAKRLGIDTIPSLNIKRNWKERRWKGDWIDGNHGSDRDGRNDGGDDYGVDRDAHNHENSFHRQAHFHRIPVGNFEHAFDGNREDGLSRKEGGFRRHDREIGNRSDPSRSNNSKFTDHKFDNDRLSKSSIRRGADDKFRRIPKRANDFRRRANNFFQRWEQPGVFRTKS